LINGEKFESLLASHSFWFAPSTHIGFGSDIEQLPQMARRREVKGSADSWSQTKPEAESHHCGASDRTSPLPSFGVPVISQGLILDNYGTHKTAKIRNWLAKRPRLTWRAQRLSSIGK